MSGFFIYLPPWNIKGVPPVRVLDLLFMIKISIVGVFIVLLMSCSEDEIYKSTGKILDNTRELNDTEGPTVELHDPFKNKTYKKGGALPLNATFKDASGMKSCAVTIKYNDVAPQTQLKGISSLWAPAENGDVDNFIFGEGKEEVIIKAKLFDQNIDATCLAGIYIVTFNMEDKVGNTSQMTVNIVIVPGS